MMLVVVVKNKKNALVKTINKINHSTHTHRRRRRLSKNMCLSRESRSENDDICGSGPYKYPTCFCVRYLDIKTRNRV